MPQTLKEGWQQVEDKLVVVRFLNPQLRGPVPYAGKCVLYSTTPGKLRPLYHMSQWIVDVITPVALL